ncbi:MAG: Crp/Fnr family transcriptional regulator [Saprospiraceae bacterium]|nr:Crp/Fnr family transcriptional regulator [Saprospiraceae bacterium]
MDLLDQIVEFRTSSELRKKLFELSTLKTLKKGEVMMSENSYIRSIPIVISGSLGVIRTDEDGKEILLYYIKPGESCIMSFLGGMHNEKSKIKAVAEENTEILFLPIEKVRHLIREYPQWLDYIFRLYHKRFEELLEVVNAVAFRKVDERLMALLRKKMDLTGSKTIEITHEQLANELATARVVISRLLKQLEDEGVVSLGRNKITLLKPDY